MNFNHINRNSLMNSLYGSRNSYQSHPNTDQQLEITEEHHLNPSKSKVNIKQSLNKTIENCKMNWMKKPNSKKCYGTCKTNSFREVNSLIKKRQSN